MNECSWAEQVALYAGGDLDRSDGAAVVEHLTVCRECSRLLAELQSDRALLHQPPAIPDVEVQRVHVAVHAALARQRSLRQWMAAAAALIVLIAGGVLVSTMRQERSAPAIAEHHKQPGPPVVPHPEPTRHVPVRHVRRNTPRHTIKPPAPESANQLAADIRSLLRPQDSGPVTSDAPVMITAVTSDPDVVIVLIGNSNGGFDD